VALPAAAPDLVRLKPLTGPDHQEIGLFLPLERQVEPASFPRPDPGSVADAAAARLLFDAARLSLRSGAAPFRSLGHISVTPRPYQFVPLIMALRLDPVRLLIADDVGVGKTIEAGMIARELLDRGIVRRLCVPCPAHLCDQWERELRQKFAIDTAVVRPSSVARLERELPRQDLSIYEHYPHLIASIDFVKAERHRGPFLRTAPDLVIVDEAHGAARPRGDRERGQHQRHELIHALATDRERHLLLVTATPHSGIEESFRSLLGLLDRTFEQPPPGSVAADRRRLLPHVIQRRRKDVERWLGAETPFPERVAEETRYDLGRDYLALYRDVLEYCRETVEAGAGLRAAQQRVRYWAAIALLRCLLSSPGSAQAVLAARAQRLAAEGESSEEEKDSAYRPQVTDVLDDEEAGDYMPTAPFEDAEAAWTDAERRRLAEFMRRARALDGAGADRKLEALARTLDSLLQDGFRPVVFCRFIATANYLASYLPKLLGRSFDGLEVRAVTGEVGDEERRERIEELVAHDRRVLVATDCLSEGINLQEHFDAVVHYDLPWNPNRLEQREGRVDRFGQPREEVKTVLLYGTNNEVDQVVLDVLLRKARTIRNALGVSVPVPVEAERVVEAVVGSVLLRRPEPGRQMELAFTTPEVSRLHDAWDRAAAREKEERAFFSQSGIQPDEVERELEATDGVLGKPETVLRFLADAVQRAGGEFRPTGKPGVHTLFPGELGARLKDQTGLDFPLRITLDARLDPDAEPVGRTHPVVAAVADEVLSRAFAAEPDYGVARAGAIFTGAVDRRTALLLLRIRYLLREETGGAEPVESFAEEIVLAACRHEDGRLRWLEPIDRAGRELANRAEPVANMPPPEKREHLAWALDLVDSSDTWYRPVIEHRIAALADAHARLRRLTKAPRLEIHAHEPPDVMGCFVLVPTGRTG
jgi:superfamily II DNA or RNA helicase